MSIYTIQKRDTLWGIVKKQFKLTTNTEIANKVNEVARKNGISNPNRVFAGQTINFDDDMGLKVERETTEETGVQYSGLTGQQRAIQEDLTNRISGFSISSDEQYDMMEKSSISLFGNNEQTEEITQQQYNDFAKDLLINKYDRNGDGTVSVNEFNATNTLSMARTNLEQLPQQIRLARAYGNEEMATELEALQQELQDCIKEYEQIDEQEKNQGNNLFAQNLDINGNGNIEAEELGFFLREADSLDGKTDGTIKDAKIRNMTKSFIGENASDEFKAKYGAVIQKYQQGLSMTQAEMDLLKEGQAKLRNGMQRASGIAPAEN